VTTVKVPFEQAVLDTTGGNQRLLTTEYKAEGAIPVIDQGRAEIAGFTDDLSAICHRDGPVILFGDHTRTLKFVDFDFALGADGVKVLKPLPGFDARFLFHFLRTVQLPENLGYSRHFKFLKECRVPKPTPEVQQRIATLLDKADSLHRNRLEAIRLADELLRATFFSLLGDPVANSRGWPELTISEIGVVTTGNTPDRSVEANFGSTIEWIKSDNINTSNHYLTIAREGLSAQGMKSARTVSAGSTLMTCIAGSPSCIGNVAMADRAVAFNQQINAITPRDGTASKFLYTLLLLSKSRIQAASTNSMKGMVSKGALEKIRLIWPPESLQERVSQIFDKVATLRSRMEKAERLELYASLQAKLMS
jgi:type I restriction enzyme S subunit